MILIGRDKFTAYILLKSSLYKQICAFDLSHLLHLDTQLSLSMAMFATWSKGKSFLRLPHFYLRQWMRGSIKKFHQAKNLFAQIEKASKAERKTQDNAKYE